MSAAEPVQKSPLDVAIAARNSGKSPHPPLDPYKNERRATPLDLDPEQFGERTFPHLSQNPGSLNNAQTALRGLHKVETEVHRLQAEGVPGPHIAKRGLGEAESALRNARERIELLSSTATATTKTMDSLLPRASDVVAAEIRAYIRAQPNPLSAAMSLISSADAISANAVLRAPEFLSGLDARQRDLFQTAVRKAFTPREQNLVEDIDKAIARVEAAILSFESGLQPRLLRWSNEVAPAEKVALAFPTDIERMLAK